MKFPVLITWPLAVLACSVQAQQNSPSWRSESDMPTRNEVPEVTVAPEIEFKVDRGALMGGFDHAFGSESDDAETADTVEAAQPAAASVQDSALENAAATAIVDEQAEEPAPAPAADVVQEPAVAPAAAVVQESAAEQPAVVSASPVPENDAANQSMVLESEPTLAESPIETLLEQDEPSLDASAELAYLDPSTTTLHDLEVPASNAEVLQPRRTDFMLVAVESVEPEYPRDAWLEKTEGWVDLRLTIDSDGTVADAEVVDAQPKRVFDRSAIRALRKSTFRAPSEFGLAGPQTATLRIEFDLGI